MKLKMKFILLVAMGLSLCWTGCQKEVNEVALVESSSEITLKTGTEEVDPCEVIWDLRAGQTIDVGSVIVTNDADNIYVTFKLDYQNQDCVDDVVDAEFGTVHVWVGNDLSLIHNGGNSRPAPGQMAQQDGGAQFDATGLTEYTFTLPWDQVNLVGVEDMCNKDLNLYVVTHAEVKLNDCDGNQVGETETGYGGPEDGPGNSWWYYGIYTVCCDGDKPPQAPFCETAFAKGEYVFTTGKKSNPEKLGSLGLTKNRWGWAIELTEAGDTEYEIWAGAGLNDTGKGVHVGTLNVSWDGSQATVTYIMFDGYCLEEVHLFADDGKPNTIAPGQFGNTVEFDPNDNFYEFVNIPLVDTDDGSVWLIAHAVVCNNCD
jgi:hypothetical protein